MAINGRDFLAASRGELAEDRAAKLGRELAASAGHDIETGMTPAEWATYAHHGARSLLDGRGLPRPAHSEPERPAAPRKASERVEPAESPARVPVQRAVRPATGSSRPLGRPLSLGRIPTLPGLGSGPVGRLMTAGLAGLVVLEVGSLWTQRFFTVKVGAGGGELDPADAVLPAAKSSPSPAPILELFGAAA
jgi:hypothetical protein